MNDSEIIKSTPQVSEEDQIYINKQKEELDDSEHSLQNTKRLNAIYSQLIRIFFGNRLFYFWAIILLLCFIFSDKRIADISTCYFYISFVAEKILHSFGFIVLFLLSFPTAKGIRKFMYKILDKIIKR